jgi:small-conductance mechanosensitive channel
MSWKNHFLFQPLAIGCIIALAILLQAWVRTRLVSFCQKHHLPSTLMLAVRVMSRWILILLALLGILAILGVEFGNLWTLLSTAIAMVAIGFVAVWSMLSNILAFFLLLVWHHWGLGDRITVLPENLEGNVEDMNLMFTVLRTKDGGTLAIPNNMLLQRFVKIERGAAAG